MNSTDSLIMKATGLKTQLTVVMHACLFNLVNSVALDDDGRRCLNSLVGQVSVVIPEIEAAAAGSCDQQAQLELDSLKADLSRLTGAANSLLQSETIAVPI